MTPETGPEPAWLTAKVDQRLSLIKAAMMFAAREADAPFVMTYLDEPAEGSSIAEFQRWERTCDNCGRYCPDGGEWEFWTGYIVRVIDGRQVLIAYGICSVCRHEP